MKISQEDVAFELDTGDVISLSIVGIYLLVMAFDFPIMVHYGFIPTPVESSYKQFALQAQQQASKYEQSDRCDDIKPQ